MFQELIFTVELNPFYKMIQYDKKDVRGVGSIWLSCDIILVLEGSLTFNKHKLKPKSDCLAWLPTSSIQCEQETNKQELIDIRINMAPSGRFKKQRRKPCHVLSQEEIKFLAQNTNFETKTIVDWHKVHP